MKTSELTGALLNYWVARAKELRDPFIDDENGMQRCWYYPLLGSMPVPFDPSTNCNDGWPIIDGKRIAVVPMDDEWCAFVPGTGFAASVGGYGVDYIDTQENYADGRGPTSLIAGLRAFVASVYGDEVPDVEP